MPWETNARLSQCIAAQQTPKDASSQPFHHQPGRVRVKVAAVLALLIVCAFCVFWRSRQTLEDQPAALADQSQAAREGGSSGLAQNPVTPDIIPIRNRSI